MGEEKVLNTDVSRFGFMFKKIAMPTNCMREWLRVPEFTNEINTLLDSGDTIDNQKVLEICTAIIDEKAKDRAANKEFHFQTLRRGANHVRRALEGDILLPQDGI